MTPRDEKALIAVRAAILELQGAEGLIKEGRILEAESQIFKAHAYTGAARMYLDQERAIELAVEMERHASRTRARIPLRGRPRP